MSGAGTVTFAGWPNPVGWVIDKVSDFVGGVATAGFEALIGGLVAWVTDAVVWVVGGVFNFFLDAADPNVQADWFITGDGPYATTATIGATLLVGFVLAGITQTVLAGIVLVAELTVRAALVYLVVALAPLVFAARLWPVLQGVAHKLVSLLAALVLSKLVMAVAPGGAGPGRGARSRRCRNRK